MRQPDEEMAVFERTVARLDEITLHELASLLSWKSQVVKNQITRRLKQKYQTPEEWQEDERKVQDAMRRIESLLPDQKLAVLMSAGEVLPKK